METFPRCWPFVREFTGHRWITLRKANGAELYYFLWSAWTNGWVNHRDAGVFRRQDGVSNHQPHGCLLNRLFRRRSKKTSKLRVTGLCVGNSPGPVNSPHKGPVTRKMFPFDDVIMTYICISRPLAGWLRLILSIISKVVDIIVIGIYTG